MDIAFYVEDIIKSPEATFMKIVSTIISKNDKIAEIEIVRQHTKVDIVLFEAIKSILDDLKKEEGVISRFLYNYFNIEIFKNKKREQLIILGSQLKTNYNNLNKEIKRVDNILKNVSNSLYNLKLLRLALYQKKESIHERKQLNKCNAFIKKLNTKIETLSKYETSLQHKFNNLEDNQKMYSSIYYKIPQYQRLKEEYYTNLLSCKT